MARQRLVQIAFICLILFDNKLSATAEEAAVDDLALGNSEEALANEQTIFVSNLNERCLQCISYGMTNYNLTAGVSTMGHRGPFQISKIYWEETLNVTLPHLYRVRNTDIDAFKKCASDYYCASRIVRNYMNQLGQDCNNDNVTNCADYLMTHVNGGYKCSTLLSDAKRDNADITKTILSRFRTNCPEFDKYKL